MARQRSRSNTSAMARDPLRSLLMPVTPSLPLARPSLSNLFEVEDLRTWHPDPEQGALTIGGRFAAVIVHKRPVIARANTIWSARGLPVGVQVPVGFRFESPFKVITCLRRKVRRGVIFARGKAGFGVRRRRVGRRSWRSNVSC